MRAQRNVVRSVATAVAGTLLLAAAAARADLVTLEWVRIDHEGNDPDDTGRGAVADFYRMAEHEVTNAQYTAFLNAVATVGDPNELYHPNMGAAIPANNPNREYGGIVRTGSGTLADPWVYSVRDAGWAERPVNLVEWLDCARFANWLHNAQPEPGTVDPQQTAATTEDGAYDLLPPSTYPLSREPDAVVFLPTLDEWYKAAYYDPDKLGGPGYWNYATGSDTPPDNNDPASDPEDSANYWNEGTGLFATGPAYFSTEVGAYTSSLSPFGTADQNGNIYEWTETPGTSSWQRILAGGSWRNSSAGLPAGSHTTQTAFLVKHYWGFRVATNADEPPVADADGPHGGLWGEVVTLDGRGSYDPDGDPIVTYEWTIEDYNAPGPGDPPEGTDEVIATSNSQTDITIPAHWLWESVHGVLLRVFANGKWSDPDSTTIRVIPEPASCLLVLGGLAAILRRRRRR